MYLYIFLGFLAYAVNGKSVELLDAETVINAVNSMNTTWKAGHNFPKGTPMSYIRRLLGTLPSDKPDEFMLRSFKRVIPDVEIPEEFDARKQWPNCPTIRHIYDQGSCGSCWAVATASSFSDKLCIFSGGNFTAQISVHDLLTCCHDCGYGCDGGLLPPAWRYLKERGLATGGDFNSSVGCQPYQIPECQHYTVGNRPDCQSLPDAETPGCRRDCSNPEYPLKYRKDVHKMKTVYYLPEDEKEIQKELMTNGPLSGMVKVYSDFLHYKSGVYQYTFGKRIASHAIRILGWGTENKTPYWLVANSWNEDWGDKGFFKILRGVNECFIEGGVYGGVPDV